MTDRAIPEDWETDQHARDIQKIALDLDEEMGKLLHGAKVRFERFDIGNWVAYLVPFDYSVEYVATSSTPESALFAAMSVYQRNHPATGASRTFASLGVSYNEGQRRELLDIARSLAEATQDTILGIRARAAKLIEENDRLLPL